MKPLTKLSIILLLFFSHTNSYCQDDEVFYLKAYTEHSQFSAFSFSSVGLAITHISENKKWELEYPIQFGLANKKSIYVYTGVGQAFGAILLHEGHESNLLLIAGIVTLVIPESITFNFITSSKSRIGIYGTAWGFEYRNNNEDIKDKINYSAEGGFKYSNNNSSNKTRLTAFLGTKKIYGLKGWSITGGLGLYFNL